MKLNATLLTQVNISTTVGIPGSPFQHFWGPEEEGPFSEWVRRAILNS